MIDLENLIHKSDDTKLKVAQEEGRRLVSAAFQFQQSTVRAERKIEIMKTELEKASSVIAAFRSNKTMPHESSSDQPNGRHAMTPHTPLH